MLSNTGFNLYNNYINLSITLAERSEETFLMKVQQSSSTPTHSAQREEVFGRSSFTQLAWAAKQLYVSWRQVKSYATHTQAASYVCCVMRSERRCAVWVWLRILSNSRRKVFRIYLSCLAVFRGWPNKKQQPLAHNYYTFWRRVRVRQCNTRSKSTENHASRLLSFKGWFTFGSKLIICSSLRWLSFLHAEVTLT